MSGNNGGTPLLKSGGLAGVLGGGEAASGGGDVVIRKAVGLEGANVGAKVGAAVGEVGTAGGGTPLLNSGGVAGAGDCRAHW